MKSLGFLSQLGVSRSRLGGVVLLSLASLSLPEAALDRLDRLSMQRLLETLRLPPPVFSQIAALCNVLFVVPLDRLPASEALRTLRDIGRGGAGRYHAGGYGQIAEQAAAFVDRNGSRFLPSCRVERVLVRANRAVGVQTRHGSFHARAVISNAGLQPTVLKLVGEEHFPAGYVTRVRRLEPSWALVGLRYHLARPVFDTPMTIVFSETSWLNTGRFEAARGGSWPRRPLVFVTVPSLYDKGLATPEVPQVALIGTLGSPDLGAPMNAEAVTRAERVVEELWPEVVDARLERAVYSSEHVARASRDSVLPGQGGECIGLGQLIGQCGREKPKARSPLRGLFFVGCDAGGYGCGTHQAVDSGFNVADAVLAELRG